MLLSALSATLALALNAASVSGLNCEKDALANYRLSEVFKEITTNEDTTDTPPSKTKLTWYLNLCDQVEVINEDCPKNSQICGVQTVLMPGEAPITSQIISFGNGLNYKIAEANDTDVVIKLDDASWGSNTITANIQLHCAKEEDISVDWDLSNLVLNWDTPAACLKTNKDVPPPKEGKGGDGSDDDEKKKKKDKDDSWGWFTWLFIIFVILIGGYIIIGAWITASKSPADLQDAAHEFIETSSNLAYSLPGFVSEIAGKIFGSNSSRGGYSAV